VSGAKGGRAAEHECSIGNRPRECENGALKNAGKKLDVEVKAIVWPELYKRPKARITARERKAAKLKNEDCECLEGARLARVRQ
jgi:hypothetical protein